MMRNSVHNQSESQHNHAAILINTILSMTSVAKVAHQAMFSVTPVLCINNPLEMYEMIKDSQL
jgi:hypothetical protein